MSHAGALQNWQRVRALAPDSAGIPLGRVRADESGVQGSRSFRELDVYALAVEFRREIVRLTSRAPVCRDFTFVKQIRGAARGGPRNIAEGFSRFNPVEFRQFLSYAKASLDEAASHLQDGFESGYFDLDEHQRPMALLGRTLAAVRGLMRYLESPAAMRKYKALLAARNVSKGPTRT